MNILRDPNLNLETALPLLARQGFGEDCSIHPLEGGRNNRVYEVCGQNNQKILLKAYFKHPNDKRDRCRTEYSFLQYAAAQQIDCVPRPIDCDFDHGLALYSFIDGEKVIAADLCKSDVDSAAEFFIALNRNRNYEFANSLNAASEACFSIAAHIAVVEGRINRLAAAGAEQTLTPAQSKFIQEDIANVWAAIKADVVDNCRRFNFALDIEVPDEHRVLSPSDCGFHNAVRSPSGRLFFLDFEYAGWDDIAKTVCDFFLQPAVPVPPTYFDSFTQRVLQATDNSELCRKRIDILLPVYRIKWCAICLNDFLPVGEDRRGFSLGRSEEQLQQRRQEQLTLAKSILETQNPVESICSPA